MEFRPIEERCKLYGKRRDARLPNDIHLPLPFRRKSVADRPHPTTVRRDEKAARLEVYDRVLDCLMPPHYWLTRTDKLSKRLAERRSCSASSTHH